MPSSRAVVLLSLAASSYVSDAMRTNTNSVGAGVGAGCGDGGSCIDVKTSKCDGGEVLGGLCAGPWNIKCCVPAKEEGVGEPCGSGGTCIDTGSETCGRGRLQGGLCPGGKRVKCCLPPPPAEGVGASCGAGGTCIDTDSTQCGSGRVQGGLCPGGRSVKCCLPAAKEGVGAACGDGGSCIDTEFSTCDGETVSGLCPGSSKVMCCQPKSDTRIGGCKGLFSGVRGQREAFVMKAARDAGLRGVELAQFLAQSAHECDNFNTMEEYASGRAYEGRKDLGNTERGDGVRYKGRGYLQITGRYNYRKYGKMIGQPLEENPTLAEEPQIAAEVSLAYWDVNIRAKVSDFKDTRRVTKLVNGGYNGLDDRIAKFKKYLAACSD